MHAGAHSHARADKMNCFIDKKIDLQFATAYLSYEGHDPWHTQYMSSG